MLLEKIPSLLRNIQKLADMGDAKSVARRLFVTNSFDGLLTSLGVILGLYIGGVESPRAFIGGVLGGSLTMGFFSGFLGAFFSERAERLKELKEMQAHVMKDLSNTIYGKITKFVPLYVAFWSGLGVVLFPFIVVTPFALSILGVMGLKASIFASVGLVNTLIFLLGVYLGHISRENKLKTGGTMLGVSLGATLTLLALSLLT